MTRPGSASQICHARAHHQELGRQRFRDLGQGVLSHLHPISCLGRGGFQGEVHLQRHPEAPTHHFEVPYCRAR
eukprot:2890026-Lingulodinium_polyedra.AAC.1